MFALSQLLNSNGEVEAMVLDAEHGAISSEAKASTFYLLG